MREGERDEDQMHREMERVREGKKMEMLKEKMREGKKRRNSE